MRSAVSRWGVSSDGFQHDTVFRDESGAKPSSTIRPTAANFPSMKTPVGKVDIALEGVMRAITPGCH
jgi:hypothetical protein